MALTPVNSEAFLREVDDELRRDQAVSLWRRYGRLALAALVLLLVALAAGLWWRSHRAAETAAEGERLSQAMADLSEGKPATARAALTPLASSSTPGVRTAARLALADSKAARDPKGAAADYALVADDADAPDAYRSLARVRRAAVQFDTLPPLQVVQLLGPVAIKGNPYYGSAAEMTAVALIKAGQRDRAGIVLKAVASDAGVPRSIRSRAVQLAATLGVDAAPAADANASLGLEP